VRTHLLTALVAAAVAVALVPAALAAGVRVRVEGQTQTIFGAAQPTVQVGGTTSALDALEAASLAGEFYYHVKQFSFGPFVDQIGRYPGAGSNGWAIKVNGASPQVGADKVTVKSGDVVLWYWAAFGDLGGPPTLDLRASGTNCYAVVAQDDTGKSVATSGTVLHVGSKRTVPVKGAKTCVGRHPGLVVRATAPGAVRSNVLK